MKKEKNKKLFKNTKVFPKTADKIYENPKKMFVSGSVFG